MRSSKYSYYVFSATSLSFKDAWDFLGLPDPNAPFCDAFFDLTVLLGSGTDLVGDL